MIVRLRSAGGLTSRTTSLSRPMVTASPARGTLPSGQDLGSDHSDRLTDEGGACAGAGIFMCSCVFLGDRLGPSAERERRGKQQMERREQA